MSMIGRTVSHYEILAKLGEGGMGVVYKARDTKLDRIVALKFLPSELTRNPDARTRFTLEAKAASVLDHPNICTIHEIDEFEGQSFIVMGHVEGETLREKTKVGPITVEQALDMAIQVAEGLEEAHEKGIVHRDIKTPNIMITPKGQAKIMDFGLASIAGARMLAGDSTTGGTIAYMSPEQVRGEPVDHRTDIWSLGVVLYEALTGQLPFQGEYTEALMYSIVNESPQPVSALRTGIPPQLERIVNKALAKGIQERYQHMDELVTALKAVKQQMKREAVGRVPFRSWLQWRRSIYVYVGVLAILAFVLVGKLSVFLGGHGKIDSIAVLPLRNISGDPAQEYFADGMTEALITELSKVKALRVISRRSVMRYKDTSKGVSEIARDLNVDAVVEGSALLVGGRVRINAQLIGATKDENLWADDYEGDLSDILSLQKEVARAIAQEVQVAVTPEEEAKLSGAPSVDPEAHKAYLKGRAFVSRLTEPAIRRGIEYFQEALERDPDYSLGYVGLSMAYNVLAALGWVAPREGWPQSKEEALKAVELDYTNAEAHALLADVKFVYDWDWEGAEKEYERAIELDPGNAIAHNWYAMYLSAVGRFDEAEVEITKAVELDPFAARSNASWIFMLAREYSKARKQAQKMLESEWDPAMAHLLLGNISLQESEYGEAIKELEKATTLMSDSLLTASALARAYALSGNRENARRLLTYCVESSSRTYFPADEIAAIYGTLGEKDRAFSWLERAYEERSSDLIWIKVHPRYDPLRKDPRFSAFLRKMGLN